MVSISQGLESFSRKTSEHTFVELSRYLVIPLNPTIADQWQWNYPTGHRKPTSSCTLKESLLYFPVQTSISNSFSAGEVEFWVPFLLHAAILNGLDIMPVFWSQLHHLLWVRVFISHDTFFSARLDPFI